MHKAFFREMTEIDCMYQKEKVEEYPFALKIAQIHQYKDTKTTLKRTNKNELQQSVTTLAT